jgi:hypothetical protein
MGRSDPCGNGTRFGPRPRPVVLNRKVMLKVLGLHGTGISGSPVVVAGGRIGCIRIEQPAVMRAEVCALDEQQQPKENLCTRNRHHPFLLRPLDQVKSSFTPPRIGKAAPVVVGADAPAPGVARCRPTRCVSRRAGAVAKHARRQTIYKTGPSVGVWLAHRVSGPPQMLPKRTII